MKEPLETAELQAFWRTVQAQSLSRAARELGVPRATLSRRLARLEERLGSRLLRRTTRSLALTDAGQALYRHAAIVLDAVKQAEASVRRIDDVVRGELRISVPPLMDELFFAMMSEYARSYPEVRLEVHFSTQHVDLQRDGYDAAIRAGNVSEPGLIARTLARSNRIVVASPRYLAEHGTPKRPQELRNHRCLVGFARGELPETHWPLVSGGKLRVEAALATNEMMMLCDAALRGLGIAFLPDAICEPYLARGRLVHVLAGQVEAEGRIAIVYTEREFMPPQLRAFVDLAQRWAERALQLPEPTLGESCPKQRKKKR